jgi:hypothetical protein
MKKIILCCSVLIALFSCNKSNAPTPPPPATDSLLRSLTLYNPVLRSRGTEVFGYDENAHLAYIHVYNYDSSQANPEVDSTFLSFTQTDATTPPSSYDLTFYYPGNPPAGESEHHVLFYDSLNRVIRDSITVSTTNSYTALHFIYDIYGNTTIESLSGNPQTPGSYNQYQIDTMFVTSENMFNDISYSTPDNQYIHVISRNFSTEASPLYNESLANSLGCLLSLNSLVDMRSKNLPSQIQDQETTSTPGILSFQWMKDSAGRITGGVGTDTGSGLTGQIIGFTYDH